MNLCTEQKQTHKQKQMYVYQRREGAREEQILRGTRLMKADNYT